MYDNLSRVIDADINEILPNRFQPRIQFDEEEILELSDSIKEHGIIQPIVVRPIGDKYEIIAGERRYKAAVLAGKETVPIIVKNLNDKDSAEIALIENVQRKNLTPIEEALSYKKILDMGYITQENLANKLGKSQSSVANKIRLLNLSDEVQEALLENKISERHARSLLSLKTSNQQNKMLERIISERLTVRRTDEEIKKLKESNKDEELGDQKVEERGEINMNNTQPVPSFDIFGTTPAPAVPETPVVPQMPAMDTPVVPQMDDNSDDTSSGSGGYSFDENGNVIAAPIPEESVNLVESQPAVTELPQMAPIIETPQVEQQTPDLFSFGTPIQEPTSNDSTVESVNTNSTLNVSMPEPIIVTDYTKQYDPVMPQTLQNLQPQVDFKEVINAIRECSSKIEQYGFKIDVEEYDLQNLYQVIFKIEIVIISKSEVVKNGKVFIRNC